MQSFAASTVTVTSARIKKGFHKRVIHDQSDFRICLSWIPHSRPTYQRYFIFTDLGTPKTISKEIQGFLAENKANAKQKADPGNSRKFILGSLFFRHFGMSFLGIWEWPKFAMLGTGDAYLFCGYPVRFCSLTAHSQTIGRKFTDNSQKLNRQ